MLSAVADAITSCCQKQIHIATNTNISGHSRLFLFSSSRLSLKTPNTTMSPTIHFAPNTISQANQAIV
jgi:hypothetical protein